MQKIWKESLMKPFFVIASSHVYHNHRWGGRCKCMEVQWCEGGAESVTQWCDLRYGLYILHLGLAHSEDFLCVKCFSSLHMWIIRILYLNSGISLSCSLSSHHFPPVCLAGLHNCKTVARVLERTRHPALSTFFDSHFRVINNGISLVVMILESVFLFISSCQSQDWGRGEGRAGRLKSLFLPATIPKVLQFNGKITPCFWTHRIQSLSSTCARNSPFFGRKYLSWKIHSSLKTNQKAQE